MQGIIKPIIFAALLCSFVVADISETTITSGLYDLYGSGSVSSGYMQVTTPNEYSAGIVLYNAQQMVGYGFTTEFTYVSSSCGGNGGDGFNFQVSPSTSFGVLSTGGGMAVEGQSNIGTVSFDAYHSQLRICAVSTGTSLSFASHCTQSTLSTEIRCNGPHTFKIVFTPPGAWQVWVDGTLQGNTGPIYLSTLSLNSDQAYVGFSGATGSEYLDQQITSWTFTSTPTCLLNNGGCDVNAACSTVLNAISCECYPGFEGNGYTCSPVSPPVEPPIEPPVSPPVDPPVTPPVAPPVDPPVTPPVAPPVEPLNPVSSPIAPPIVTPMAVPIRHPVSPPVVASPSVVPVIIPILECFDDLQNGTFIVYFGYNNTMEQKIVVPVGSLNTFSSPSFVGQPTSFEAGRSGYFPDVAFAYLLAGRSSLIWTLTSFRLTLDTSDTSRKCPSFARFSLTFYTERELNDEEVNTLVENLAKALGISPERVTVKSIKYTPVSRKRDLSVAELEMEIAAANSTQQNEPSSATAVQTLVDTAQNTTALAQALDPTGTSNIQPIGVKSTPTGLEQSGNAVPPASPGNSPRPRVLMYNSEASQVTAKFVWLCFAVILLLQISARNF